MMVRDARVAEEVVQGWFVAVHGGWPRLGDARAAEDYLRQEVANRSRAVLRRGAGRGGGPQQLRPGGSGEHLARAVRVAQLMTAVNGRVGQHVSSHLRVARVARALTAVGADALPALDAYRNCPAEATQQVADCPVLTALSWLTVPSGLTVNAARESVPASAITRWPYASKVIANGSVPGSAFTTGDADSKP
jgi:hypothetical protein